MLFYEHRIFLLDLRLASLHTLGITRTSGFVSLSCGVWRNLAPTMRASGNSPQAYCCLAMDNILTDPTMQYTQTAASLEIAVCAHPQNYNTPVNPGIATEKSTPGDLSRNLQTRHDVTDNAMTSPITQGQYLTRIAFIFLRHFHSVKYRNICV